MRVPHALVAAGLALVATSMAGCGGQRDAAKICSVMHAKKLVDGCAAGSPSGPFADAKEMAEFDVLDDKGTKNGKGAVLTYESKEKTDGAFTKISSNKPGSFVKGRSQKDFWIVYCEKIENCRDGRMTSFLASDD